jgi:hypothetical protein
MRWKHRTVPGVLLLLLALVPAAEAKKFRYSSGPKPPEDSTLAVANSYLDPVVSSRGPSVPYTNLQLTQFVADTAVARARERGGGFGHARVAPAHDHPLTILEHAMPKAPARRGVGGDGASPHDLGRQPSGCSAIPATRSSSTLGWRTYHLRSSACCPGA